jgi:hypothetical protein
LPAGHRRGRRRSRPCVARLPALTGRPRERRSPPSSIGLMR